MQISKENADCNAIVDGAYDTSKMRDPSQNAVVPTEFKIIQQAFNTTYDRAESPQENADVIPQQHKPILGQAPKENVINDLWAKQGEGCGKWIVERDTRWWNE